MIIYPLCLILTSRDFNSAVNPESQILPIKTNELRVRLGMIWTPHVYSGKYGKSSKHGFIDGMVWEFGHPTRMCGTVIVDGICGESA